MSDNFTTPVAPGTDFASKEIGNVQYPQGIDVDESGNPSLPQLLAVLGTLGTQTTLAAVLAAIATLDAGDASAANQITGNASLATIAAALAASLPLPTGAATQTTLAAILTAMAAPVLPINPATILSGQVKIAVTGTAIQLPANALKNGISIFANPNNAAALVVGPSGVTNTVDGTGNGDVIQPGAARAFGVSNSNAIYVNGTAGDWISWSGN